MCAHVCTHAAAELEGGSAGADAGVNTGAVPVRILVVFAGAEGVETTVSLP